MLVTKFPQVVILSPNLPIPPTKGGAIETVINEFIPFVDKAGITVISQDEEIKEIKNFKEKSVRYVVLSIAQYLLQIERRLYRLARNGFFSLHAPFSVRNLAKHIPPDTDIIHVHNNFHWVPYLRQTFPTKKILLNMHNDFLFEYPRLHASYVKILDMTDGIITVSNHVAERIRMHYTDASGKIKVVYNGISLTKFYRITPADTKLKEWKEKIGLQEGQPALIFVGRITEIKGVHILLQAFQKLSIAQPDLKLIIVGTSWYVEGQETPYIQKIQEMAAPFKDRIKFTGFVGHNDLNYLYNLATVCVVPSIFEEPFGLVNLEAMAAGCMVVASDIGGIPEIIQHGINGLLFKPGDPDDLVAKITEALAGEASRQQMVERAAENVKSFSWPVIAGKYQDVFLDVMGNKK